MHLESRWNDKAGCGIKRSRSRIPDQSVAAINWNKKDVDEIKVEKQAVLLEAPRKNYAKKIFT